MSMFFSSWDEDNWDGVPKWDREYTEEEIQQLKWESEIYSDGNLRSGFQYQRKGFDKFIKIDSENPETLTIIPVIEDGKETFYLNGKKFFEIKPYASEFI